MTAVASRARVLCEDRPDGTRILRTAEPLGDHAPTLAHALREVATRHPARVLAAERDGDGWRRLGYAEAAAAAASIGQELLRRGLGPAAPVLLLSGNSLDHLLLTLAGYLTGVPVVPVSVAYSLRSNDFCRVRHIAAVVRPGLIFAGDGVRFRPALDAAAEAAGTDPAIVVSHDPALGDTTVDWLRRTWATREVDRAFAALTPDTVAKILFTSGSTGTPKGVLNTHRMLCANQQMLRQIWPFLAGEPPVLTDWLPWNHTFGGNHNLNLVLTNAGSIYIDDGSPLPDAFERTLDALCRMPPTVMVNVPAGYAQLIPRLEADRELACRVFARAKLVLFAGADLPDALRERLRVVARDATGRDVPVVSSWGATETGPVASSTYGGAHEGIGIPLPGVELKLAPAGEHLEIRVRGASVTPGYLGAEPGTGFDEDGFYRTGDAVRLADPGGDPARGLVFDGRIAEDFKIANGTWVTSGLLRNALLSACGVLGDVVLTGDDRPYVAAIAWLHLGRANELLDRAATDPAELIGDETLRDRLVATLAMFNQGGGAASRVERLVLVAEPPSIDHGEITDKGQINRRAVLTRRADLVTLLYADVPGPRVIVARGAAGPRPTG